MEWRHGTSWIIASLVLVLLGGCGSEATRECAAGSTEPCLCANGAESVRTCAQDGSGYGACRCDDADVGMVEDVVGAGSDVVVDGLVSPLDGFAPLLDGFGEGSAPDSSSPNGCTVVFPFDTSSPLEVSVDDTVTISVRVVDDETKVGMPYVGVTWELIGCNGIGMTLAPPATTTDEDGVATATLETGPQEGASCFVRASAECTSEPAELAVEVVESAMGEIEVHLEWQSGIPLTSVTVGILYGPYTCQDLDPLDPWTTMALALKTVSSVYSAPVFEALSTDTSYLVYAIGKAGAPPGHLAAAGCVDGVEVLGNQTMLVSLPLSFLTLDATGDYDSTITLDFVGIGASQVDGILGGIADSYDDPGAFVVSSMVGLVEAWAGESWSSIEELVTGPFQEQLTGLVEASLASSEPPWLQCLVDLKPEVQQIVDVIQLLADLSISSTSTAGQLAIEESWLGLSVFWPAGCASTGPCSTASSAIGGLCAVDPVSSECLCELPLVGLSPSDAPLDLDPVSLVADIVVFDKLIIAMHKLQLGHGALISLVLEELVLPAVSDGAVHSLYDLAYGIVDCADIAGGLDVDLLAQIGLTAAEVEGFCESSVSSLVAPNVAMNDTLSLESTLWMSGSCMLSDTDDDLQVDALTDGVWMGNIDLDGLYGAPFQGSFSGVVLE